MTVRSSVRFYLNDDLIEVSDVSPSTTLLDYLRVEQRLTGTKEGCAEGGCGACTVLVGRLNRDGALGYEAINACLRFVASLDGTHVVTIEHLSAPEGPLHPVQRAMVDHDGSQCGFCTPGIVMSLYAHRLSAPMTSTSEVARSLQGNLCRCTGYAPIIRAALAAGKDGQSADDRLVVCREAMTRKLEALHDDAWVEITTESGRAILPTTVDDLDAAVAQNPDAVIIAGCTDVGLWTSKDLRALPAVIFLSRVAGLHDIAVADGTLTIGAAVSYSEAEAAIARHMPQLSPLWDRIGGRQIRNAGTVGGNIVNGSPIGDTPPTLIALGTTITLRKGGIRRVVDLEDFFIAYGRRDLRAGEFLESVSIRLPADALVAAYKVSKRFDDDITAVLGAFRLRVETGVVHEARIAYGGMAGVPKRAAHVEAALIGKPWSRETVSAAMTVYDRDFEPLTDWRASSDYRMRVARNLLLRFFGETTGTANVHVRERVDA